MEVPCPNPGTAACSLWVEESARGTRCRQEPAPHHAPAAQAGHGKPRERNANLWGLPEACQCRVLSELRNYSLLNSPVRGGCGLERGFGGGAE